MQTNVFAYTASGSEYPEYLSINVTDGAVEVTVRGPKQPATRAMPWTRAGEQAIVKLQRDQVEELHLALGRWLAGVSV